MQGFFITPCISLLQGSHFLRIVPCMIYTDAHCHITEECPTPTIAGRIVCATREDEWTTVLATADDDTFAAIGIHPWYIANNTAGWDARLRDLLLTNPMAMVGEAGLDKHHDDMAEQIKVFMTQLEIAAELRRPLHLHCVGSWDKILHIFKTHAGAMPPAIIAHAFNGDAAQIPELANKYNMYFSYGAEHNDANTAARIAATPATRILCESDSFDAMDATEKLADAIDFIATVCGISPDEMTEQINMNFDGVLSYVRPIE